MFPKISPSSPNAGRGIFKHPDWVYELKHDGFRALAYLDQGRCRFVSRKGNEMKRFEDLGAAIRKQLKIKTAVLDGEIVALDESGMPAFYRLMRRKCHAVYYAFELLWLDGKELRELPLLKRKKILRSIPPAKIILDRLCQFHWTHESEEALRAGESERSGRVSSGNGRTGNILPQRDGSKS
jgi:bifunctional non-homologous end joining protein LigD